jgi:hypothetical protein
VLHLLDRRVGWCYAHPCAATRPGSTQVVLLIGTGVCASAAESAQVAVQLPAVSDTSRYSPVIVFAWMGPACRGVRDSPRCCASGSVMLQSAGGMAAEVTGCLEQSEVTCPC